MVFVYGRARDLWFQEHERWDFNPENISIWNIVHMFYVKLAKWQLWLRIPLRAANDNIFIHNRRACTKGRRFVRILQSKSLMWIEFLADNFCIAEFAKRFDIILMMLIRFLFHCHSHDMNHNAVILLLLLLLLLRRLLRTSLSRSTEIFQLPCILNDIPQIH